jgi:hypothetical protein
MKQTAKLLAGVSAELGSVLICPEGYSHLRLNSMKIRWLRVAALQRVPRPLASDEVAESFRGYGPSKPGIVL